MSTEQSVDPELVEQTKQQIRNLVREIAQISKSNISPQEFYDAVLNRVVTALAAIGDGSRRAAAGSTNFPAVLQTPIEVSGNAASSWARIRSTPSRLLRKQSHSSPVMVTARRGDFQPFSNSMSASPRPISSS